MGPAHTWVQGPADGSLVGEADLAGGVDSAHVVEQGVVLPSWSWGIISEQTSASGVNLPTPPLGWEGKVVWRGDMTQMRSLSDTLPTASLPGGGSLCRWNRQTRQRPRV